MQSVEIIEKSLELLNSMLSLVRESTRAGGHVLQNFTTMSAWVLVTGMIVQFTNTSAVAAASSDKKESGGGGGGRKEASSSSSRVNLAKAQQGFGVLSVALASQALTLTAALLDDLTSEVADNRRSGGGSDEEDSPGKIEPANFDLFAAFTATQRVALIFDSVPFIQLLFNMAVISYKKSCNLKCLLGKVRRVSSIVEKDGKGSTRVEIAPSEEPRAPTVSLDEIEEDSYSDDDEDDDFAGDAVDNSSQDDDDDDDDSEPLLGKWFEETLQGEIAAAKDAADREEDKVNTIAGGTELLLQESGNGLHVPDKGEPAGFISLASHIFIFMDKHMLATESSYVKEYLSSRLSEQQMVVLATIVQDLDRDTNSASLKLEYHLASLYSEFSTALASFTHNVLAHGLLTTKLQGPNSNEIFDSSFGFSYCLRFHFDSATCLNDKFCNVFL